MTPPLLSILTPAIWRRADAAQRLADKIASQRNAQYVEHITIFDDCKRSVGLKRQACLDAAIGDYIAFVDDDDDVSSDYVPQIIDMIQMSPDLVTFNQRATINGQSGIIKFGWKQKDEGFVADGEAMRGPWHVCVWRAEIAQRCIFPDISYGEDIGWALQARRWVRSSLHIDEVLHHYRHSTETTAAPPPTH